MNAKTRKTRKAKPRYVVQIGRERLFGPFWTAAAAAKWAHKNALGWIICPVRPA